MSVVACKMDTIHAKSAHTAQGMGPSVCLTPAPPAPSPIPTPYPVVGNSAEGVAGPPSRTKIMGAKIITVGGCFKACHGNEPGTLKETASFNTAGACFPIVGAASVLIELGMAGITGTTGMMNRSPGA